MIAVRKPISFWDNCWRRLGSNRRTKPGRSRARPSRTLRCEALEDRALLSATYYVASGGNDAWDGLAGAYTSGTHGPWKTVAKVNSYASFHPGDSVLFERGDTWRESLTTQSGDATGNITYGAYGNLALPDPLLLGSIEQDNSTDWTNLGGNVWTTTPAVNLVTTSGSELLPNPSFTSNASNWTFAKAGTAQATGARTTTSGQWDTSPAGYKVSCTTNDGSASTDITLRTSSVSVVNNQYYLLTFRAKCTSAFTLAGIDLKKNTSPYTSYASSTSPNLAIVADGTFHTYTVLLKAGVTASDGRLTFYLGAPYPRTPPSISTR